MVKDKPKVTRVCGICGVALKNEEWVYSPSTGERYCLPSEWDACAIRADKPRGAA